MFTQINITTTNGFTWTNSFLQTDNSVTNGFTCTNKTSTNGFTWGRTLLSQMSLPG